MTSARCRLARLRLRNVGEAVRTINRCSPGEALLQAPVLRVVLQEGQLEEARRGKESKAPADDGQLRDRALVQAGVRGIRG